MKIPVLAFYNTLAEKKTSNCLKMFWNKEKLKIVFFLEKSKKIVNFKIGKKWKLIA